MDYSKEEEPNLPHNELMYENLSLQKELERKEILLEGLLFDLHLLQESASNRMHIKDESEKLILALSQVRCELEEVCSLNDKLEMAYAFVDEKEAIAVEAPQESVASKLYAEQKEKEVKILESSVEELQCTINVLEKKVYEMDEELDRHQLIRNLLEHELQVMRKRLLTLENFTDVVDSFNRNAGHSEDQISRLLELHEAHDRVKQCKEYISEIVLHSEAQAMQYQQKYKTLEAMVREVKTDLVANSVSVAPILEKTKKCSTRTRGSSSPFRCIANLVQRMNFETDQELSMAKHRIEELEELVASRQKEVKFCNLFFLIPMTVCTLNTRLAAAESMTHDLIRDLLLVRLDMTNYAESDSLNLSIVDFHKTLATSERRLSRVNMNNELALYWKTNGSQPHEKTYGQGHPRQISIENGNRRLQRINTPSIIQLKACSFDGNHPALSSLVFFQLL
ncbi:hypothetical protein SLEP1_g18674 [Rubroshorea leprosula]|uniref:Uncharacterized protein n=1 Tax=Rubroshorea leprosula TaxID=152421 RepID=A0AAV5JA62_9ROSI|nr:hypothetical protein SLEP1_g18674 [Rubroshorea leprosula]